MYLDLFICALLLWAIFSGWRNGFIKEVFSTIGVILGLVLAAVLYYYFSDTIFAITGTETNMVLNIVAFLLLWIIIPLMLGMVANMLTAALKGLSLNTPNNILGMLFSVGKFAILLSCVLNMMLKLNILSEQKAKDSHLLEPVCSLMPFVHDELHDMGEKLYEGELSDTIWIKVPHKESNTESAQ